MIEPPRPLSARTSSGVTRRPSPDPAGPAAPAGPSPDELALEARSERFDMVARVQAEDERELNTLRDMAMKQMQKDDENLKKWIELI